jgi:hypothetical protein
MAFIASASASVNELSGQEVTIRGRVERQTPYGVYGASGVMVTLRSSSRGRSSPVYAGSDGMYYLNEIPPGRYALEVWPPGEETPRVYTIEVPAVPYFDIAPIVVR